MPSTLEQLDRLAQHTGYELQIPVTATTLRDHLAAQALLHTELRALIDELRAKPWHRRPKDVAQRLEALLEVALISQKPARELAELAFGPPHSPAAYAELRRRGLVQPGFTINDTYRRISEAERAQ